MLTADTETGWRSREKGVLMENMSEMHGCIHLEYSKLPLNVEGK
jgi:hypothetical protein